MSFCLLCDGRPLQKGFKAHRERGIGRYAQNLLRAMLDLEDAPAIKLLVQDNLEELDFFPGLERVRVSYAPGLLPIGKRLLSHHVLARRTLAPSWETGEVVHFISHLDAPCRIGPRTVITVHDLIAQRMKKLYRQKRSGLRFQAERWLETRALFQAARLVAVSHHTKNDLVELYGIDPQRITVIYEAPDPALGPVDDPAQRELVLRRYGLRKPYFLYVGGIDARKDTLTLLQALAQLRGQKKDCLLAMAGKISTDKQYPAFTRRVEELGLRDCLKELGFVPDSDLPALYSGAKAFVFPSLYEGFGLPPLEAMACGAPVIAVRAAAVPEVVGDGGILVEPGDAAALAQAMIGLVEEGDLAPRLRVKGLARAQKFSWQRAARETLAVYKGVLE